jgi:hypothetical protein
LMITLYQPPDNDHLRWNIRNWQNIHWSDESRFLLRPVDGRMRVWRQINTAYNENNIFPTSAFCSGGVTVWGCFSLRCKLDLMCIASSLPEQFSYATLHSVNKPYKFILREILPFFYHCCSQFSKVSRFRTERYRCSAFWQPSTGKSSSLHGWQRQTT